MTEGGVPRKAENSKVEDQSEEAFYILICHFDFLCLIFELVRDFPAE